MPWHPAPFRCASGWARFDVACDTTQDVRGSSGATAVDDAPARTSVLHCVRARRAGAPGRMERMPGREAA